MVLAFLSLIFSVIEILILDYAYKAFNPALFMSIFYFFAFLLFVPIFFRHYHDFNYQEIYTNRKILAVYILCSAFGNALWFTSLFLLGATTLAVVSIAQRGIILYFSTVKMNEKMSYKQYALSAVMLILTSFFMSFGDKVDVAGVIVCVVSYALFAFSDICQKKLSDKINWKFALTARQLFQFILFTTIAVIVVDIDVYHSDKDVLIEMALWALIASILAGVLGKICHYKALSMIGLSRVTLIEQLKSVLVFFVGVLFFDKLGSDIQAISGAIVAICLVMILKEDVKRPQKRDLIFDLNKKKKEKRSPCPKFTAEN